ncbi:MAG: fibronectin type III domain-containing protein, partial [Deltaproteobacteria bacterium]|nr:fibronectin type III domain-containing protein [Deltaproteobacteria bacterium]
MQLKKTWPRISAAALAAALVSSCSSKNGLSGYSIGSSKLPICTGTESADAKSNTTAKKCVTDDTLAKSAVIYVDALTGLPTCDATRKGAMYYVSQNKTLQSCDGSKWQIINAQGAAGPQGEKGAKGETGSSAPTSISNYYTETGSVSTVVESGKTIARTITKFWTAKNGSLIKTCTSDTWSEVSGVANGFKAFSRTYGDALCGDMTTESLACNSGYASVSGACKAVCSTTNLAACNTIDDCVNSGMSWVGDRCVGACSQANLIACNSLAKCQGTGGGGPGVWIGSQCSAICPAGQTPTSRGCEATTICTATQQVVDNRCVDTSFAVQGGNLCGKYPKPIKLDSGYHLVNCDVDFQDAVTIEPGAVIAVDGAWTIRFAKTLHAIGTADLPITFEASIRNPMGKWLGLIVGNSHGYGNQAPFTVTGTHNFGTKAAYITVKNLAEKANGGVLTLSGYITNLTASSNPSAVNLGTTEAPVYLENSTITGDTISVQMGGSPATSVIANTLTAATEFTPTAGIVARNTVTAPNTQVAAGSPGLLLFNTINGNLSCASATTQSLAQVYGNAVSGTVSLSACGNKGDNTSTLAAGTWAFGDDGTLGRSTTTVTNRQVPLTALLMTAAGWVTNATVTLELTTVLDGTTVPINLQPGYSPVVIIGLAGIYSSRVKQVTGLTDLLGNVSRTVTVVSQGNGPIVRTVGAITNTPTWMWTSAAGVTGRTYRYKLNDPNFMTTSFETKLLSYSAPSALLEGVHTFYVQEKDDHGNWSDATSSSILLDKTVPNTPTAPTGPSPFTNSATVVFNWTNPGDNAEGSGVASYNVQIGTTSGGSNVFSGNVRGLSKSITGSDRDVYYARVQTVDYGGNVSPYSGSSASVTIDLVAPNQPDAPTAPSSLSNSDSLTFSWSSPGDNLGGSGITSYNVQIGTTPGGSDVFNGNVVGATSKTVAVTNGNVYYARVQAVDSAGNTSLWSSDSNSVTVDLVAPDQPAAPTTTNYFTRITRFTFSWVAPADNPGGTGVARYNVRIGTTPGGTDIYSGSETGLIKEVFGINGVVYYASVQAVDRAGNLSAFSNSSQVVIVDTTSPPQPAAPTTPNSLTNSGSVTFYWTTAADNTNGSGIASYNLQVGTSPGASDVFNGNVTTLERTVTLTNAPSYYARIQAVDKAG